MSRTSHPVLRDAAYRLEAVFLYAFYYVVRALPCGAASALGGWIGRTVGPRLRSTRTARRNLTRAFPEKPAAEIEAIIRAMWDNLGRTVAEYPHLEELSRPTPGGRTEFIGAEHVTAALNDGKGGFLISGHLANWEMSGAAVRQHGMEVALVYRAPNNPYAARLLLRNRDAATPLHIPKGAEGARMMLRHLKEGGHIGMLVDQKMNDGIPVPFFGRNAMTAPAGAHLALKFGLPLLPVRVERLGGPRFRVTVFPPLDLPHSGDRNADVLAVMTHLNDLLESWIRERPEQWLWIHRRWPD